MVLPFEVHVPLVDDVTVGLGTGLDCVVDGAGDWLEGPVGC